MQTDSVPKDKTFNIRLDADDRRRLDAIAESYAAPAATAIRMLIKKEFDALEEKLSEKKAKSKK